MVEIQKSPAYLTLAMGEFYVCFNIVPERNLTSIPYHVVFHTTPLGSCITHRISLMLF